MLVRFKKLFSTDKILEKARDEMNKIVIDLDKVTERDIFLTSEATKRIQEQLKQADKQMEDFKEASNRLRNMIADVDKYVETAKMKKGQAENYTYSNNTRSNTAEAADNSIKNYLNAGKKFNAEKLTSRLHKDFEPGVSLEEQKALQNDEMIFTEDGAAYKEIPLIITNVMEDKPVVQKQNPVEQNIFDFSQPARTQKSKQNLSDKVKRLYTEGYDITDIAAELSCSVTEVQFIIDML